MLRTFVWGCPHQYRAPAPPGTAVGLELSGAGTWTLPRTAGGWELDEGRADAGQTRPAGSSALTLCAART